MSQLKLSSKSSTLKGSISIAGSKSISNRLLIMRFLGESEARFQNLSDSEDTLRMQRSLKMISTCSSSRIPLVLDAGNAGTVFRFLTALLCIQEGKWLLTGSGRMQKRPVGELVSVLQKLGAAIVYTGKTGYPPLLIEGGNLLGGEVLVDPSASSQFISALMMIAPILNGGLKVHFKTKPVSFPYIKMTAGLLSRQGIKVLLDDTCVTVEKGNYIIQPDMVEPDWSSASYWYEMAVLSDDVDLALPNFTENSIQGDMVVRTIFGGLGIKTIFENGGIRLTKSGKAKEKININCSDFPDLVPAIMATCAATGITAKLDGVSHLRYKESDRLSALKNELAKIGADVAIGHDSVEVLPGTGKPDEKLEFNTYDDHRIAMSLAPLAIKFGSVVINKPGVVEKSYPAFWNDIQQSGTISVEKY